MSAALSVLDYKKALQCANGNKSLADDLLAQLITELPAYTLEIQQGLQDGNREDLRKVIHKIHGGLRYLGTPALLDIVSRTDIDLLKLTDEELKQNITLIFKEIDRLIKAEKYSKTFI